MTDNTQLARLARPFPKRFVHTNPSGGGSYVTHSVVNEKLLAVLGGFDFELVEILRGSLPAINPDPNGKSRRAKDGSPALVDVVVGVVCRLSASVDGRARSVCEVGDCESPHNWPHDGARLKDAMSDALKRCAMRYGVGLHLWSQDEFTLYDRLAAVDAVGPYLVGDPVGPGEQRYMPGQAERLARAAARAGNVGPPDHQSVGRLGETHIRNEPSL